ncbi:MAG: efflux RND transporter periplasmic adaptor subunit [Selenomonadaceae bacterium]|nr:efflux RND transporter periplasmic adaptor subunit [Selenomonadaceae bacterium]
MDAQKYLQIALVAIIGIIVAVVGYALFLNENSRKHIEKMEDAQYAVLKTTRAKYISIHPTMKSTDITVKALWTVDVKAQHEGILTDILTEVGQFVDENSLIARVTNEQLGAQLAAAEASISEARASLLNCEQTLERYQRLVYYNAISRQKYDNAVAQRDAAKAQLENRIAQRDMTQADINKLEIFSPRSAFVVNIYHKAGDYIRAGEPILLLSDFNELQATAVMEHDKLQALTKHGQDFVLEIPAHRLTHRIYPIMQTPNKQNDLLINQFPARIENIVPALSDKVNSHEVTWRITNHSAILEPTYYNNVTFSAVTEQKILAVPRYAVIAERDKFFVYIVDENNYLRKISVNIGDSDGDFFEITSGLKEGDLIVMNDRMGYTEGMKVRVDNDGE